MTYTVTLNPAVDLTVWADAVVRGATNRAVRDEIQFGGKGINVATVLARLGEDVTALGFAAGFTGDALRRAVEAADVQTDFVRLREGYTRINVKLIDGTLTEINGRGPSVSAQDVARLAKKLDALCEGDTLVLAGSVPAAMPQDIYRTLLARVAGKGVRVAVDADGETLRCTLAFRPFVIKPNRAELESLMGTPLTDDVAIVEAARTLQQEGAVNVLVSLGKDGALLLDEYGTVHRADAVGGAAVNPVGAGDSMLAGFLAGVRHGYAHALKLACAAGGATACAAGLATADEIRALLG